MDSKELVMTDKTKEFLQKLKDSGHWNEDYDYSKVEYISAKDKVVVIDNILGTEHLITPSGLLGVGTKCGIQNAINHNDFIVKMLKHKGYFNNDYDYSKINYTGSKPKLLIIDTRYGTEHLVSYSDMIGRGTKCTIQNAVNQNEHMIKRFKAVHGDRYDYSLSNYIGSTTPVTIICEEHGEFKQSPNEHNQGNGCSKCCINYSPTTEEVIERFREVHGDRYDYSKVDYTGVDNKVVIVCPKHGEFEQTPYSHNQGNNCPKCSGIYVPTTEEVIKEFRKVHGDRYDYSKVDYKFSKAKIKIICPEHGEFEQRSGDHKRGQGCPKCVGKYKTTEEIIEQFREVHGDIYDYSKVDYKFSKAKIKIICPEHGEFEQLSYDHKSGKGCPICNSGWNRDRLIRFFSDMGKGRDILLMDSIELMKLIEQGKLPRDVEELVFEMDETGDDTLRDLKERVLGEDEVETDKTEPTTQQGGETTITPTEITGEPQERTQNGGEQEEAEPTLPTMTGVDDLLVLDNEIVASCDDETVEFFISHRLNKYWNEVINGERDVNELIVTQGGTNFQTAKRRFLDEYQSVLDYQVPEGYNFRDKNGEILQPFMMQKLTVLRVKNLKRYGNWSGTGAGKTNAFIITSREIDSKLTLVVGLNATINQLGDDIKNVFPDSIIYTRYTRDTKFDRSKNNYLLLNYEKFQQDYSEGLFQDLTENNQIDFIVIDEVHNVKQRTVEDESTRRGVLMRLIGRAEELNTNLHLLVMSATPVINNLMEAKSLLQLTTGEEYDDIHTRSTISNAIRVFSHLTRNGVRYRPKYDIRVNERTGENTPHLRIDGTHLVDRLVRLNNTDYVGVERTLLADKLHAVSSDISKGTIIYSYYTDDGVIHRLIGDHVNKLGYTYGFYTGEIGTDERVETLNDFISGKIDVLISSGPITTGIDGLQKVSDKIIITTLPWTDANYVQLKGRLQRTGSNFNEVNVIIPQIYIDYGGETWSLDRQRLSILRNKRTIADAAVDGVLPSQSIITIRSLHTEAFKSLEAIKERLESGDVKLAQRDRLTFPLRPEVVEREYRRLGDFSELNQKWSVTNSTNTHKRLSEDPTEWYYYHTLYSEKRQSWSEIPYIEIANKIKVRPDWVVGDFGCGENLLSKEIGNKVYAFDHVAIDDTVYACDINNVPIEDNMLDVAVFSLSLMGSNHTDYFKEAYRTLKIYGNIFVCEPASKWDGREEELKNQIESVGFKCFGAIRNTDKFIYIDGVKY
jgi:superfamily II DNA or RNA helicase